MSKTSKQPDTASSSASTGSSLEEKHGPFIELGTGESYCSKVQGGVPTRELRLEVEFERGTEPMTIRWIEIDADRWQVAILTNMGSGRLCEK